MKIFFWLFLKVASILPVLFDLNRFVTFNEKIYSAVVAPGRYGSFKK